jgi:hypothetical protein
MEVAMNWTSQVFENLASQNSKLIDQGGDRLVMAWLLYLYWQNGKIQEVQEWVNEVRGSDQSHLQKLEFAQPIFVVMVQIFDLFKESEKVEQIMSYVTVQPLRSALQIERNLPLTSSLEPAELRKRVTAITNEIDAIPDLLSSMKACKWLVQRLVQAGNITFAKQVALQAEDRLVQDLSILSVEKKCRAIAACADSLAIANLTQKAQQLFAKALAEACLVGRGEVFRVLTTGVELVDPTQVMGLVRALEEIDDWWSKPSLF